MSVADEDPELLAGEYVLGLVSREALGALWDDPRFQAALQAWEARLAPLAETLPPVAPRAQVWSSLQARLVPPRPSLWNNLIFWRGLTFGLGALATAVVAAALTLVLRPVSPVMTATLTTAAQGSFVATTVPAAQGVALLVAPAAAHVPAGRTAELWLLAPGAKPAPLGLLADSRPVSVHLPVPLPANAQLAISLEPPGGSPTGLPTGPIIAVAKILPL
jgi:anti-sigma-K factor RskA